MPYMKIIDFEKVFKDIVIVNLFVLTWMERYFSEASSKEII